MHLTNFEFGTVHHEFQGCQNENVNVGSQQYTAQFASGSGVEGGLVLDEWQSFSITKASRKTDMWYFFLYHPAAAIFTKHLK